MSRLALKLLGPFEASLVDDRPIQFPTTKAQALFAYLMARGTERPGICHQRGNLMTLLWYGGIEVLHHAVLRMLLRSEGSIPPHYPVFLDYAVDLIFLRRVGGGYIFVHQLLQDYFARNL